MNLIEKLLWRNATKEFDSRKKIPADELRLILEAVRLAPSSYGLQLYKILVVQDDEIRKQLKEASWNQNQITDSSALIVFCNYKNVYHDHVDDYIRLKSEKEMIPLDSIAGYGDFIKSKIDEMSLEQINNWTIRQTYIALGFLLSACAELMIDACPMEGFEPDRYNEILGLEQKNLNAAVIAAVGYRKDSENNQHIKKVRKPLIELFETITKPSDIYKAVEME